ncbi:MAG: DUF3089 domain-containing protein [Clostridia bacterium]|nr:DUF3089 domain-containing protein [Clostridia bacterium]
MNVGKINRRIVLLVLWVLLLVLAAGAIAEKTTDEHRLSLDYGDPQNWVCMGEENDPAPADVFFIAPSAFGGKEGSWVMDLSNEKGRSNFIGTVNMEKGIYDQGTRFYAPFYRQVGYNVYSLPEEEGEALKKTAYADVRDAFLYYLDHLSEGRPFILAGFSQGAEMIIRLMKDLFEDEALQKRLIACYEIGWRLTGEDTQTWPWLRAAQGRTDTGVIISFNSEAENVKESEVVPAGVKTLSINPLNWRTDGVKAEKELNLGACFTDHEGKITDEVQTLTGAYLDEERGTLKVTDIDPEVYTATLPTLGPGVYHLYDYQFFYRNLQQNVQDRIQAYLSKTER